MIINNIILVARTHLRSIFTLNWSYSPLYQLSHRIYRSVHLVITILYAMHRKEKKKSHIASFSFFFFFNLIFHVSLLGSAQQPIKTFS